MNVDKVDERTASGSPGSAELCEARYRSGEQPMLGDLVRAARYDGALHHVVRVRTFYVDLRRDEKAWAARTLCNPSHYRLERRAAQDARGLDRDRGSAQPSGMDAASQTSSQTSPKEASR